MRSLAILPFLAVVAACAVGPQYRTPALPLPVAYAAVNPALSRDAPADRWWSAFGDPVLDALVEAAIADNPDLATAEARVRQMRARARIAGAAFYPGATAMARVSRDKLSRNGENLALIPFTPATTQFTDYRLGFDTAWEIDLAGRTRREVEAAVARFGSAIESRNDAQVVIAAEVTSTYVEYRVADARLSLARRNVAAADEDLRLVGLQEHAGVASASDLGRGEADRQATVARVPALESARDGAIFRLAALTAQSDAALAVRLAAPMAIPAVPAVTPIGLPSGLLRRRPDVRRAERELAAATADVGFHHDGEPQPLARLHRL